MNLMDMLSSDPGLNSVHEGEDTFFETLRQQELERPEITVHYLPCAMSTLQKDMSEAVVQIFSNLLDSEICMRKKRTSINTLLENSTLLKDDECLITESLLLMYNQLVTISMHPSLLVDHFISKGLLLLSPKDRLIDLSGKMHLFNELIDFLESKFDSQKQLNDYDLLVVAHSVKELELIEGLIVGKKLIYHNASSGKLYEEYSAPVKSKIDTYYEDSPTADGWRRLRLHNRIMASTKPKPKLVLHLITSNQLCNSYSSNGTIDLVFSFDTELDLSSPGLDLLRRNNRASLGLIPQRETPLFIPIQTFSIEHIGHVLAPLDPFHSSERNEDTWRLKVLKAFVVNRSHLFIPESVSKFPTNYKTLFTNIGDWLFNWDKMRLPNGLDSLDKFSDQIVLDTQDAKIISSLKENHLTSLSSTFMPLSSKKHFNFDASNTDPKQPIEYQTLKRELALFLNNRAEEVESLIDDGLNLVLPDLRKVETSRQIELDSLEVQVGERYRKLRKLNDTLESVDKKFNRVEIDHQNLQNQAAESKKLFVHLEDVTNNKSEEEIITMTKEQASIFQDLEVELKRLEDEYKALTDECESAREAYQAKSTDAVKTTGKLNSVLQKSKSLEHKLNGPGMRLLPSLAREDELAIYERKLKRVASESKFLNLLFTMRYDSLVKERTSSMEYAASLSSRLNNRSRASTPFQMS